MSYRTVSNSSLLVLAGFMLVAGCGVRSGQAQGAAPSAAEQIAALDSDDPMDRAAAACALGEGENHSAIPALVELLADDTSIAPFSCSGRWYRSDYNSPGREAANALVQLGARAAAPVADVIDHAIGAVREKAVWVLASLDYREALEDIEALLESDDYFLVRANAAWAMGAMDETDATQALRRAVTGDDHARVREQAAWALGAIGAESGVDALGLALSDADAEVRSQAAWALGAIGDAGGVETLIGALGDEEEDVRSQAAWALGAIGDPRAADGLLAAIRDDSPDVRKQAIWALSAIR